MILRTTRRRRRPRFSRWGVLAWVLLLLGAGALVVKWSGADWRRALRNSPKVAQALPPLAPPQLDAECPSGPPERETRSPCAVVAAMQAIRAANARQPDVPWTGTYRRSDGYVVNEILLGADGQVVVRTLGDSGNEESLAGVFVWRDARIEAHLAGFYQGHQLRLRRQELIPVRWGPRRYLILFEDMDSFVNAVNENGAAMADPDDFSSFPVHEKDEPLRVCGMPELPSPWNSRLRLDSVGGTIGTASAIDPQPRESSGDFPGFGIPPPPEPVVYRAHLDHGSEDGLYPGQALYWDKSGEALAMRATVEALSAHGADLIIVSRAEAGDGKDESIAPRAGMRFFSRNGRTPPPECDENPAH